MKLAVAIAKTRQWYLGDGPGTNQVIRIILVWTFMIVGTILFESMIRNRREKMEKRKANKRKTDRNPPFDLTPSLPRDESKEPVTVAVPSNKDSAFN